MIRGIDFSEFQPTADWMPSVIHRYQQDREILLRSFTSTWTPYSRRKLAEFCADWQKALEANELPHFDTLTPSDKVDFQLLQRYIAAENQRLSHEEERFATMEPLLSFALPLFALDEARRRFEPVEPVNAADLLEASLQSIVETQRRLELGEISTKPTDAYRAAKVVEELKGSLNHWFTFYHAYDPLFTWWVEQPYHVLDARLSDYAMFLRAKVAGAEDKDAIIGDPIGRDALLAELQANFIAYTPEELCEIGDREMEWCLQELIKAADAMGYVSDWRAALEVVKRSHLAPGEQTELIRRLAREAEEFVENHNLVTVPELAKQTWRMEMMSPEMQKINPFFLGGEEIIVSFPTHTMEHTRKRMSLRGNNPAFARATVQHELIPGHHLQMFCQARYRPYRQLFYTPFWVEGWTLHWEMLLWELGFPQTPEQKMGMLFWRAHRCARVRFSLRFHLGQMTPQECVEMLVNDVGHERENALAEVRRSFGGDYDPLYQCAYLIGGLQVHSLYNETVGTGKMSSKVFHDRFLRTNSMPIEFLRHLLLNTPIALESAPSWRFAG